MTTLEYCLARRKAELPAFVRVLKAVPEQNLDYRPDPKARNARDLAWLLAYEEQQLVDLIEKGECEWKETPAPASAEQIAAAYGRAANKVNEGLARLDEAGWEKKVKFLIPGAPPWEDTLGEFAWGFLFDAIHHRGQLSTYLRPMGGKVPSIYGPSADDPGQ